MWRPITARSPSFQLPSSKPSIPPSGSRASRQYGVDATLATAPAGLQSSGGAGGGRRREQHGGGAAGFVAFDVPQKPQKQDSAALRCLTGRTQPRGDSRLLRSSSANADLFQVRQSASLQNISISKCHLFFFKRKRSDVVEVKKNGPDRRDSHTLSIRERV